MYVSCLNRFVIVSFAYKGLVMKYGEGGAKKWENRESETFCTPLSRQGKAFYVSPLKGWKPSVPLLRY